MVETQFQHFITNVLLVIFTGGLLWVVMNLVEKNIAKADAVFLTGWSYGGYLTLLGLGKAPELWAGGMAGVALADWVMNYEDSAETLRGYQVSLFGGTPEEKMEQYRISSPINP